MWWTLIACVLSLTAVLCDPVVNTAKGAIGGRTLKSRDGRDYHSFIGIPYAKPPVDELRFKVNDLAKTHENPNKTRGAIWMTENKNFGGPIKLQPPPPLKKVLGVLLCTLLSFNYDTDHLTKFQKEH